MSVRNQVAGSCALVLFALSGAAAPPADPLTLNRIADAAFNHGEVVDMAAFLADQIGGRLTNSPAMRRAEGWAQDRFRIWGLKDVRTEPFEFGRGWWIESAHVRMTAPRPLELHGIPVAWTPATNGALNADVIVAPMVNDKDFADWKGKLSGKIVLVTWPGPPKDDADVPFQRLSDADIVKLDKYQQPTFDPDVRLKRIERYRFRPKLDTFLAEEGAVAWVQMSRAEGRVLHGEGYGYRVGKTPKLPGLELAAEDYRRLARLATLGDVKLEIDSRVHFEDADHNAYNPGAGLCFDCHMNANAAATPWGYTATFGATKQIMGYFDSAYFATGIFGNASRYPYKGTPGNKGGHFGASIGMSSIPAHQIGGLCTPCHDPHGVSPTLGINMAYAVPLLKGTWLSSPYKEDAATADNAVYRYLGTGNGEKAPNPPSSSVIAAHQAAVDSKHIDQNTFGAAKFVAETEAQFAGLCLSCHSKTSLTNGTDHTWAGKNRVHESVKGWKTSGTAVQHQFVCSKCHTPHNADLPRLMVTDCLDANHRGRVAHTTTPVTGSSYRGDKGSGKGAFPGGYFGGGGEDSKSYGHYGGYNGYYSGGSATSTSFACHETKDATNKWNNVTRW